MTTLSLVSALFETTFAFWLVTRCMSFHQYMLFPCFAEVGRGMSLFSKHNGGEQCRPPSKNSSNTLEIHRHLTPRSAYVSNNLIFTLQNRVDVNKMKLCIITAGFVVDRDNDFFTSLEEKPIRKRAMKCNCALVPCGLLKKVLLSSFLI